MKKIMVAISGLVVLAGIALFILVGNLDKIVKGGLETIGSELLGTQVTVSAVNIEIKSRTGQISGLCIANPAGFPSGNAFQMDTIRLGIAIKSLGKQPLVINELIIKDPVVRLDAKNDGSSNLQTLMNNMEKNSKKADSTASKQQPTAEEDTQGKKGEPIRIAFGKLAITGVTVQVNKEGESVEKVVIPNIEKQNVGGDTGLSPAEIGNLILGDIISSSLRTALQKKLTEKIGEAAGGFFDTIKGTFNSDESK